MYPITSWNNAAPKEAAKPKTYVKNAGTVARDKVAALRIKQLESDDYDRDELMKLAT